ncbi:MAG TPA: DUF3300 domain-containing protein [Candidatus Binatia bacterium]
MKRRLALSLVLTIAALGLFLGLRRSRDLLVGTTAEAQEESPTQLFSPEQLDNLLAPIALYPDPLVAQVLLAATFVDQIDEASRWLRAYNNSNAIDDQLWDVSVKAVAHYPSVLYMMSDQLDWTTSVGQAYVYQSTDVMTSIQRLRASAYAAGNLISNQQQEVIVDGGAIAIVPAQPQYIYVPSYDPQIIYFGPASYYGLSSTSIIFFGPPFFIGAWLNHDCDWRTRRIYYHGWRGRGWITRSRPIIRITNIYVNNRYSNVQINRNIIHKRVNYINLSRYNSVHRDVNYNNLIRDRRPDTANANAGNKIIRRNLDVTDPRLDTYRGRSSAQAPTRREEKAPPTAPAQQAPSPAREQRPSPPTPPRTPQVVRPAPQPPPRVVQPPSASVFGGTGGVLDPRASSQRGQESRGRINQPPPRPQSVAPGLPANRSTPSAPRRR